MKLLIVLSTFLNLVFIGSIIAFRQMRPNDFNFVTNYITNMDPEEKALLPKAVELIKSAPEKTEAEMTKLLVTQGIKDRYKDASTPEAVQQLLVAATRETIANIDNRRREQDAAIERSRLWLNEFPDFMQRHSEQVKTQEARERQFEELKARWEEVERNDDLKTLVERINKAKKAEDALPMIAGRSAHDQKWVFSQLKGEKAFALFKLLPESEQAAIKQLEANPLGATGGEIGKDGEVSKE